MSKEQLLLEYLKENYAQARQHETRQTNGLAFIIAASAVILGLAFKDGQLAESADWHGLILLAIGVIGWRLNYVHFRGNRFHAKVAGKTREALETIVTEQDATAPKPSAIRNQVSQEMGLYSVGDTLYQTLKWIPIGIATIGIFLILAKLARPNLCLCISG